MTERRFTDREIGLILRSKAPAPCGLRRHEAKTGALPEIEYFVLWPEHRRTEAGLSVVACPRSVAWSVG
jgi:hypothetical protein